MKLHMDLDCFFVSAERTRCEYLNDRPIAVAKSGDKEIFSTKAHKAVITPQTGAFNSIFQLSRNYQGFNPNEWKKEFIDESGRMHGIVIAKSYEAKKFNIKTGTSIPEALYLCPNLIIIPSDHLFYQLLSHKLRAYLETKIPLLEQYSIDEFFGDVSGWIKDEDIYAFIKELQTEITNLFNLPITIAAAPSKWTAKLLTDRHKPYGLKVLYQSEVAQYLKDVPIEEFAGVGGATAEKLKRYGCHTIGDAPKAKALLYSFGKTGRELYDRLLGVDNDEVSPQGDRKSIGISRNFLPILQRDEIVRRVIILSRHLAFTINELKLNPTAFYYKIRYEDYSKSKISLTKDALFSERGFIDLSIEAFHQIDEYKRQKIRHIAISASSFANQSGSLKLQGINAPQAKTFNLKTYDLFSHSDNEKLKSLDGSLAKIRNKWGVDIVRYGVELEGA